MTSVRALALSAVLAATTLLAGCSGGATGSASPTVPAPAATSPATAAPTSTASRPAAGPTTGPASTGATPAPSSPAPLRSDRCTASVLSASLGQGGGAAGSVLVDLVLTNTGPQRCTLQGWPGVSFVGDGNGTQLGAAGDLDRSSPHGTVTLDPGKSAHAPLRIARAENYPADTCQPVTADGLRVYAPGATNALFVATTGLTACRNADVKLIFVQALLPGS